MTTVDSTCQSNTPRPRGPETEDIFDEMTRQGVEQTWTGIALSAALALAAVIGFYHQVLFHPDSYMFNVLDDGLPNYFTFAWHSRYDTSLMAFGGMHYPYGEYIPYVDCHPALSSLLQCFHTIGVYGANHPVGLLNLMMLLVPVAASIFLFLVLRQFRVPVWMASVSAPAIIMLSSQAILMQFGHYALTYSLFFPMGWYLLLKFNQKPESVRWSIAIILNTLLWAYTHNYLGAILVGFTAVAHLCVWIGSKSGRTARSLVLRLLQILIPLIVIYVVAVPFDPHTGRIEMPFNPVHTASVYSVFMPNYAMTRPLFAAIFDLSPQLAQPWARVGNYIGIPSIITTLVIIGLLIRRIFTGRGKGQLPGWLVEMGPYLISAVVLLGIAMGWHFKLTGPEWLESVPMLKQFVGLGRFAWAFYYVVCVMTIVMLSRIRNAAVQKVALISTVVLYALEGAGYHQHLSRQIVRSPNYLDPELKENVVLKQLTSHLNPADYQAIIPLPFYHKSLTPGTFSESERSIVNSIRLAYRTGIPLVSAVLSRYSIDEARNIIQLFAPNQYEKPIEQDFPDHRPFLVLYDGEELEPLEKQVFSRVDTLAVTDTLMLGKLSFDSLFDFDHAKAARAFHLVYDTLSAQQNGWRLTDSTAHFEYLSFNQDSSARWYRGGGAWSGPIAQEHILFRSEPLKAGKEYELSFWYFNHGYDQVYNDMWVEEWNPQDSVLSRRYQSATGGQLADHGWVWNATRVTPASDGNRLVLRSKGKDMYAKTFYLDELMLRETGTEAYKIIREDGQKLCLKNNQTVARALH